MEPTTNMKTVRSRNRNHHLHTHCSTEAEFSPLALAPMVSPRSLLKSCVLLELSWSGRAAEQHCWRLPVQLLSDSHLRHEWSRDRITVMSCRPSRQGYQEPM